MPDLLPQPAPDIRSYYDQNTRLFLSLGSSARSQAIHRAVWTGDSRSLDEALNYTNRLVLDQARQLQAGQNASRLRVVDLGCGVGGSLAYLLKHLDPPPLLVGLTISGVQARLGQAGLAGACALLQADFQAVPLAAGFDLTYAIESFVHAAQPERFLAEAARLLRPGGRLALCDDFLALRLAQTGPDAGGRRWLQAYQHGWRVPNLAPLDEVEHLASRSGLRLVSQQHLTPYLRLRALPDPLARSLLWTGLHLPLRHPIFPSMLGSLALQQCLKRGLVQYHFLVFAKEA